MAKTKEKQEKPTPKPCVCGRGGRVLDYLEIEWEGLPGNFPGQMMMEGI